MTLVALDPEVCPDCGEVIEGVTVHQPALIRHGGYGATATTVWRHCPGCGWALRHLDQETRP